MSDRLPSSEPDRTWAERIGRVLEALDDPDDLTLSDLAGSNVSVESSADEAGADPQDDALLQTLFAYRRTVQDEAESVPAETSERMWAGIEEELQSEKELQSEGERKTSRRPDRQEQREDRSPRRSHRSATAAVWRAVTAAAALAVVGVVAWWWMAEGTETALVAEAETRIVTYETAEGSVARLRPNSRLYRLPASAADGEENRVRFRLEGEAAFDVTPHAERVFEVEARGTVVRVLGTQFTVRTWTPDPEVFLTEGRVEVRAPSGDSPVILHPGQRAVAGSEGIAVDSARAGSYVDWLTGQLTFEQRPARAVAAELGQHFGIAIRLPDSVATQTLTGRLLLDSRAQSLQDFGVVLGGRFVEVEAGRFVLRSGE